MKRVSRRRRRYLQIVKRKRTHRNLISKAKAKLRRGGIPTIGDSSVRRKLAHQPVYVEAPRLFYVAARAYRRAVLAFFDRIQSVVANGKPVHITFRKTRQMMPCGTLLFLAELDRLQRFYPGVRMFSCDYPKDPVVEQVLQQVGLLDLLRKKARQREQDLVETVKHWRYATGVTVEGAKVEPLVGDLEGRLTPALSEGLFVGLTEAMTNCSHHAYLGKRGDGLDDDNQRRWWMFSQEKDGMLSVCFCDLGIGIPRSVQSSGLWTPDIISQILNALQISNHAESSLIRAALELSRTRTHEPHRGKGLPQILDVVRGMDSGFLRIHSNQGMYHYGAQHKVESLKDFSDSIRGTLIQWHIALPLDEQLQLPIPAPAT